VNFDICSWAKGWPLRLGRRHQVSSILTLRTKLSHLNGATERERSRFDSWHCRLLCSLSGRISITAKKAVLDCILRSVMVATLPSFCACSSTVRILH
jgi:hypothetical protein